MRKLIVIALMALVYTTATAQKYFSEITLGFDFGKDNAGTSQKVLNGNWTGVYNIKDGNTGIFYTFDLKQTLNATGQKPFEKSRLIVIGVGQNKESMTNDDIKIAGGIGGAIRMIPLYNSQPKKTENYFGAGLSANVSYKDALRGKVEAVLTVLPRSSNYSWKKNIFSGGIGLRGDLSNFGLSAEYSLMKSSETEVQIPNNQFHATISSNSVSTMNACVYYKFMPKKSKYSAFELFAGVKMVNVNYRIKSNQQGPNSQLQNDFNNFADPISTMFGIRMNWWKTD
ncbi:MAG: hypothetical protein AAB477_02290 [Patescibacteria group bacterium]